MMYRDAGSVVETPSGKPGENDEAMAVGFLARFSETEFGSKDRLGSSFCADCGSIIPLDLPA